MRQRFAGAEARAVRLIRKINGRKRAAARHAAGVHRRDGPRGNDVIDRGGIDGGNAVRKTAPAVCIGLLPGLSSLVLSCYRIVFV